jgi:formylglycine-generating enzyme required for sulfatase activity
VSIISSLKDIDQAVAELNYRSETTLKYKLIHAIRNWYTSESSLEALQAIDTEELVKSVWETGDNPELIRNKKKNFSSLKSGVNTDLKKLYSRGKNPQGIIINHGNVFDISNEAKNKTLASLTDVLREKGVDAGSGMTEILAAISDILAGAVSSANQAGMQEEIGRLKKLIGGITAEQETPDDRVVAGRFPDRAYADICRILKDREIDAATRMNGIRERVKEILSAAISSVGTELDTAEADRIRNIFGSCAQNGESFFEEGGQPEDPTVRIFEEIEEAGDGEVVEIVEEVVEDEIPAEPGEALPADEIGEDEIGEIVEEISDEELSTAAAGGGISRLDDAAFGAAGAGDVTKADIAEYEEVLEADDSRAERVEVPPQDDSAAMPPEPAPEQAISAGADADEEILEVLQEVADDEIGEPLPSAAGEEANADTAAVLEEIDVGEEIVEEWPLADDGEGLAAAAAGTSIDGELQNKAEFLNQLAEAAKALEKIGPDLSNSIYSEEEIREKAKLLSDEFEHYLSVREKFYNQHILIKGGNYLIGGTNRGKGAFPEQIVDLREFYIGKFPITNALFEIFVEKTGYVTTAEKQGFGIVYTPRMQKVKNAVTGKESCVWNRRVQHNKVSGACWHHPSGPQSSLYIKRTHPVVQVSLEDACAFAAWIGKRIPTESEWEAAARTSRGYIFPWGNTWRENACNLEESLLGDTTPVDFYLESANDYGVADTLGNVLEWTLDGWKEYKPGEESGSSYAVKGASWISDAPVRLTDRQPAHKNFTSNILGFRCIAI